MPDQHGYTNHPPSALAPSGGTHRGICMALLDAIEWRDTTGDELVYRWPPYGSGNVKLGAQLTVRESQAAIFFRDGKALDVFGPGRHTLTSANLPLIGGLVNLAFGGKTPFQAEVYFVNMKIFTNMKWGTPTPIIFPDEQLHSVRLRAHGSYTMRVESPQLFVNGVVGTEHCYDQAAVSAWLRNFIASRFNDTLGEVMKTILDLPRLYDEIGVAVKAKVGEDFSRYGLELVDFLIEAITPPEEVMQMIDERARMEAVGDMGRFTQFRTAQAIGDMAKADGGGGQGMGLGAGMGAGMGMGAAMAEAMRGAFNPNQPQQAQQPQQPAATQPQATPAPAGAKFCHNCGAPLVAGAKFCSECGTQV